MIIVLSGEAGAGKDSVADILVERHKFIKYSLAGPLKRFAEDMFGFNWDQVYGPSSARNAPDPRWARPCTTCNGSGTRSLSGGEFGEIVGRAKCQGCDGTGKINDNSPRRVLQLLGSEYMRDMIHPDALTIRASWDLKPMNADKVNVVINDARYENDRNNLHAWVGALRVDVRAPNKKSDGASWRKHKSELDRPIDAALEYVLENPEEWPFPSLAGRVEAMLRELAG
jgi:hypothetical protein